MVPLIMIGLALLTGRSLGTRAMLYLLSVALTFWLAIFAGVGGMLLMTRSEFDLARPPTRDGGSNWVERSAAPRFVKLCDGDRRYVIRADAANVSFDGSGAARQLTAELRFADDDGAGKAAAALRRFLDAPDAGPGRRAWRSTISLYHAPATATARRADRCCVGLLLVR